MVFLQDALRFLDHVTMRFTIRPFEQSLFQLALKKLQEAVRVCMVMDTTANDTTHTKSETGIKSITTKSLLKFTVIAIKLK